MMLPDIETMVRLLGLPIHDDKALQLIGEPTRAVERSEHYGFIEFETDGITVVFKEAPWVVPNHNITDPNVLHFVAFHLHARGHEGYQQYKGDLPGGVAFGDSADDVLSKLGEPVAAGGGGMSKVLKRRLPRWLRYDLVECLMSFQFDDEDKVEMVTVFLEDQSMSVS
jgi:hypothetical protein